MPNYRRARTPGGTYFFTVVTYNRQPILCLDISVDTMKDVIKEVMISYPFCAEAWVILPDHMHCLWTLPEGDSDYSIRWALIKKEFTKRVRSFLEDTVHQTPSRERRREGTTWQRRFWEHQIRDEKDFNSHMDYVHFNPVKHGLVKCPKDWPHSTFHRYVAEGWYEENWGCDGVVLPDDIGRE